MLQKLKEYKELLGIIIFFLGGFIWIQNQYPTKADLSSETGVLECLLDKYMTLTQLQLGSQELDREVQKLSAEINDAFSNNGNGQPAGLSPAMTHVLDERKRELASRKEDLRKNKAEIEKIFAELARNICGKG